MASGTRFAAALTRPEDAVSGVPQPHIHKPNGASLLMSWRPVEQLPTPLKLPVMRSLRVYSNSPFPIGCQPVSAPAQSRLTSLNVPSLALLRTTTMLLSG
jgi:hypothetical protein